MLEPPARHALEEDDKKDPKDHTGCSDRVPGNVSVEMLAIYLFPLIASYNMIHIGTVVRTRQKPPLTQGALLPPHRYGPELVLE